MSERLILPCAATRRQIGMRCAGVSPWLQGGPGAPGAVPVDRLEAGQVKTLAEYIRRDHGHIDVLVNDIRGGELLKGGPADWNKPVWEHSWKAYLSWPRYQSSVARMPCSKENDGE